MTGLAGKQLIETSYEVLADLFGLMPVGSRLRGPGSIFIRTGKTELLCVEGDWSPWTEGLKEYMQKRGVFVIDRRPMEPELRAELKRMGLQMVEREEN